MIRNGVNWVNPDMTGVSFADWDGDGSRDLVLGSEYGGVHWYRNLESTEDPQFGERENLIEALEFKRRDEKDGPEGAGSRSKVFVTDYNGDGLTDLLVGDVQWLHYTLPPLTADQEARKAEILPDYEKAASELDAAYDERNALVGKDGGIPEAVEKRIDRALEKWRPLAKIMEEFDREKSNTHGWVWLYLQAKS